MSIYVITGVVSLLTVLGLLFYWLKKRKKSNHSTKYGGRYGGVCNTGSSR